MTNVTLYDGRYSHSAVYVIGITMQTNSAITQHTIQKFQKNLGENPNIPILQNAVTNVSVENLALNRSVLVQTDHTFSNQLDDWKVTNQKSSGRCWMFAGMNLLRVATMKEMNVKEFEFSQNFVLFWDKIERANFFLEAIIETAGKDIDDRKVAHLLSRPMVDGGQWDMFADTVEKYGLVPKAAMPETESSSSTRLMNFILNTKLRQAAETIRGMHESGSPSEVVQDEKEKILDAVFRILSIHLGTPPSSFVWQWKDKDGEFRRDSEMTPLEFKDRYVAHSPREYICLVSDPRPSHPYGKTYTVEYLGSVHEAEPVLYLNVETERMKHLAMTIITEGEPVWFGCDMGKMAQRKMGIMDASLYEYERIYETSLDMEKSARLEYHQSSMNHAMLFTGVDILDGTPRRWRVENSWGDEPGEKGFFVMSDSWFDQYVFEIAVLKSRLTDIELKAIEEPPTVLPPWDPMGALAY